MVKNGYLKAKKERERQAREAAKRVYVAPAGHEVTEVEVLNGPQLSADVYLEASPKPGAKPWPYDVRRQKHAGIRPMPSASLTSAGADPDLATRAGLLDQIAALVDEHVFGRADMCLQFAALLERALRAMGVAAVARVGEAEYRRTSGNWMEWRHAWVVLDDGTLVDGNADAIRENRVAGQGVHVNSFWGPRGGLPDDRRIPEGVSLATKDRNDPDVVNRWWPLLEAWMKQKGLTPPCLPLLPLPPPALTP